MAGTRGPRRAGRSVHAVNAGPWGSPRGSLAAAASLVRRVAGRTMRLRHGVRRRRRVVVAPWPRIEAARCGGGSHRAGGPRCRATDRARRRRLDAALVAIRHRHRRARPRIRPWTTRWPAWTTAVDSRTGRGWSIPSTSPPTPLSTARPRSSTDRPGQASRHPQAGRAPGERGASAGGSGVTHTVHVLMMMVRFVEKNVRRRFRVWETRPARQLRRTRDATRKERVRR